MTKKCVDIMIDIETLGLDPRTVVTQFAFAAYERDDPETIIREAEEYLPIQPQLHVGRTIRADTVIWWMGQSDAARAGFNQNSGDDMAELIALVQSLHRKISQVIEEADEVEIWAKGPQFDIVAIESLFDDIGLSAPWKYGQIRDLRTIMAAAGVDRHSVEFPASLTPHHALSDCKYQILQLTESWRRMRARN